jgi:hypothetical protein
VVKERLELSKNYDCERVSEIQTRYVCSRNPNQGGCFWSCGIKWYSNALGSFETAGKKNLKLMGMLKL